MGFGIITIMNASPPFLLPSSSMLVYCLVLERTPHERVRAYPECKLRYVGVCVCVCMLVFMHYQMHKQAWEPVSHSESGHKLSLRSGAIFISSSFRAADGVVHVLRLIVSVRFDDDAGRVAGILFSVVFRLSKQM